LPLIEIKIEIGIEVVGFDYDYDYDNKPASLSPLKPAPPETSLF